MHARPPSSAATARFEPLGRHLRALVARNRIPGFSAIVVEKGEPVFLEAAGVRDPGSGAPMAADGLFRLYSMTKPIVSVAVLMLCERGWLDVTDPVSAHLPEFGAMQVASRRTQASTACRMPITIADLLAHTAGFSHELSAPPRLRRLYHQAGIDDPRHGACDVSRILSRLPLAHHPGEAWQYGRSTDVLGHLLESLLNKPLGDILGELIFTPLQLSDTGYVVPSSQHARLAEPFACESDDGMPTLLEDPRAPGRGQQGGSGLVSTVTDYARFLEMLAQEGTWQGVRVLRPETAHAIFIDRILGKRVLGRMLPPGHGFGYGMAVCRQAMPGRHPFTSGCGSWSGAAGTCFFVDPARRRVGVCLTQAPSARAEVAKVFATGAMA